MRNKIIGFWLIGMFIFSGCTMFGKNTVPYLIDGKMIIDDSQDYSYGGLDLKLYNKSDKNIVSFTMVFFMFDSDGNVPTFGRNNVVITVNKEIKANETFEHCFSLDKYLFEIPEEPYLIDYLYLSKIVYENGDVWTDPFGTFAFN